jgi:hypothetical protein
MKTMAELATENEKQAKQKQKLYYDRKARDRKLEVGQKVLILLPTTSLNMSSYSTMSSLSCFLSSDVNSGDIWTSSTLSFLCNAGGIAGFISEPVYKRAYPIPYALRDKVKKEIDDMLKAGIVEPSDSPYAAPIVLIKKKDHV